MSSSSPNSTKVQPLDVETPYALHRSSMRTTDGYTIHALDWKKQICCVNNQLKYPLYDFKSPAPLNVSDTLWTDFSTETNLMLQKSFRMYLLLQLLCYLPFVLDMILALYLFLQGSRKSAHHFWHALFMLVLGYTMSEFLKERLMASNVHPRMLRLVADWENRFEERGVVIEYVVDYKSSQPLCGVKPTESYLKFTAV